MTAQIAILNKTAIALASDSAVTISRERDHKTYNTVNKLFTLSKYAPVGIMVYGDAEFMGVPWETIVKIYRKRLSTHVFPKIIEYSQHFLEFLRKEKNLFPEDNQKRAYDSKIAQYFQQIRNELDGEVAQLFENGQEVTPALVKELFHVLLRNHSKWLRKMPYMEGFTHEEAKQVDLAGRERIKHIAAEVFQKLPPPPRYEVFLRSIARNLVVKNLFSGSSSGIVIAGFGEDEHFPVLVSFSLDCMIQGKLRARAERKAEISQRNSAQITPFAQADMVSEFMEGVHPSFVSFFENRLTALFQSLPDEIMKCTKLTEENAVTECKAKLARYFDQLLKDLNVDQGQFRRTHHINPVIDTVAVLPKEELATMAAALVNLTQFRQKITMQTETVGGPIDVAVISKGDGFIWINRKHYFEPKHNPAFFHNYFIEVTQGEQP